MEDGRCRLGLQGRLELVRLIEAGATLRAAAAALGVAPAAAHRWWHRWQDASEPERCSRECLRARAPRPRSCPWSLSAETEALILQAREQTNYGPMQLQFLCRRHRSTIYKVLARHGVSRRRRSRRDAAADAMNGPRPGRCCTSTRSSCPSSTGPGTGPPGGALNSTR